MTALDLLGPLISTSKLTILRELADGDRSTAQLGQVLGGMGDSGVRVHTRELEELGLVEHRHEPTKPGRPPHVFSLTERGRMVVRPLEGADATA